MTSNFILEACVENLEEARQAELRGAHQIELCDRLDLGGTTPPLETIKAAKTQLKIRIKVMIRPRGGNFVYSSSELKTMEASIDHCKAIGVEGVVFGILNTDNTLNIAQIAALAKRARPLEVTIHRAIDEVPDIQVAVEKLANIVDIHGVLSAGQANDAEAGKKTLRKMVEQAGERLVIIPGGKVSQENIFRLHQAIGSTCYHGTKIVGPLNQ